MWRMYNDYENCTEVDIVLSNETDDDGEGNDCTTDKAVSFHKVVLMARSEVFQAMFASGMVEAQRKRIVLPNAQHLLTLKKLKEFFYLGQVNFLSPLPSPPSSSSSLSSAVTPSGSNGALSHQDDLIDSESREADQDKQNANLFLDLDVIMELIELSNEFILERLKQLCEEFIVTTQHALFENHLVDLLIAADTYRCDQLKRNCLDYIRSNLVDLLMSNSLHPLCSDFDGKYSHLLTEAERHTWNSCAPSVSFHHNLLSTPASVIPSQRNLASTEEKHDQCGLEAEEDMLCNQEGKLRRIRTLRKKLLQIQKLEQRRAKGEHLDEYQEAKIIQSFALKDELSLLCAAVSNVSGIEDLSLKPSSTSLSTISDASFSTASTKETTKIEVIPSSETQSSDNPLDTVPQAAPLDRKISNVHAEIEELSNKKSLARRQRRKKSREKSERPNSLPTKHSPHKELSVAPWSHPKPPPTSQFMSNLPTEHELPSTSGHPVSLLQIQQEEGRLQAIPTPSVRSSKSVARNSKASKVGADPAPATSPWSPLPVNQSSPTKKLSLLDIQMQEKAALSKQQPPTKPLPRPGSGNNPLQYSSNAIPISFPKSRSKATRSSQSRAIKAVEPANSSSNPWAAKAAPPVSVEQKTIRMQGSNTPQTKPLSLREIQAEETQRASSTRKWTDKPPTADLRFIQEEEEANQLIHQFYANNPQELFWDALNQR
ncbi:hypothetical protein QOT17_023611 [Balamuthia mandrillaris]